MEYTGAEQKKTSLTVEQLKTDPKYKELHTSYHRGYVSRKSDGIIKPYSGRYGNGYIVLSPCWVSTTYCYITYYVEK